MQQLGQARQLDARPPMWLAGLALEAVDQLPVRRGDQLGLTRCQPVGQLIGMIFREIRTSSLSVRGSQIRQQRVDGVL